MYAFLYGPLFAWSPLKPSYTSVRLARADVYFGADKPFNPVYREVDHYIEAAEQFHRLTLRKRMTIIVCRNWSDFHHFLPTIRGEGIGAATPEFGTVIYVTPKVEEMHFDSGEYVRHELSHAILEQNSSLWNSLHFKRAPWLFEGVAVLSAHQRAYGAWEEFLERVQSQSIQGMFSSESHRARGFDLRFGYQAWRYFLAWLIDTRGRKQFQELLTGFMKRPNEAERIFGEVYGEPLSSAVERFETMVRGGQWNGKAY